MVTARPSGSVPSSATSPSPSPSERSEHAEPPLSAVDSLTVLRFAATFVWADREVADSERRFLAELARELAVGDAALVDGLLEAPPAPVEVDPSRVPPALADVVRHVALRAIAADGRVERAEMRLFEILDDLLPREHRQPMPSGGDDG